MPVFSASSNLAYFRNRKHFGLFGKTFGAYLYLSDYLWVHRVPYHYFRAISKVALPVV
jgi:cell division protein FtsW